jgi:hypothetical protein
MAITTLAGAESGLKYPVYYTKEGLTSTVAAGKSGSMWYASGYPPAASAPTPGINGITLSAPVFGQIPFTNPASGNTYLAKLQSATSSGTSTTGPNNGLLILADRLWHNSGVNVSISTTQLISTSTWPARDMYGATNGTGVYIGIEVSSAMGASSPTIELSYTNSEGTAGRTGTLIVATNNSSPAGQFYPIGLQAGDVGVRSVQWFRNVTTWTSGVLHLVAYRPIATNDVRQAGTAASIDAISGGFPRLYDNSVPFFINIQAGANRLGVSGTWLVSQG